MRPDEHPVWWHLSQAWRDSILAGYATFGDVWEGFPELRRFFPANGQTEFDEALLLGDTVADVLDYPLEPIEQVCGPIGTAGITVLFGMAGIGKSLFALHMAAHIAAGEDLGGPEGWKVPRARRVLYFDTEMATQYTQGRLMGVPHVTDNLRLVTLHYLRQNELELDLALKKWREAFQSEEFMSQWDVLILDTVSSNVWPSPDTPSTTDQYWLQLEPMHNKFRAAGKTVIWLDNLNKQGQQYGTVMKLNKCDLSLECLEWEFKGGNQAAFKIDPAGKMRGGESKSDMNIAWSMTPTGWEASDP